MEDTTPSYEQLYMDHQRVLAEYYRDSVDFHKQIIQLKDELADALQEVDLRTLDFERMKDQRDSHKAALASISLFVSAGIGEEDTAAEDYAKRIKDGITNMVLAMSKS
jgi:hypothetical protein